MYVCMHVSVRISITLATGCRFQKKKKKKKKILHHLLARSLNERRFLTIDDF